jgi:hypothetical protein
MGYMVRSDPALMGPNLTVRVAVMDGDRVVSTAISGDEQEPAGGISSGDDSELWVVAGPPPQTPPDGMEPGDAWIDVASGDVFVYDLDA